MNIAIGSAFRNSKRTVGKYMLQVSKLMYEGVEHHFRVIAVEGDSTDSTRNALAREAKGLRIPLDLRTCNHGGPMFGSVESIERMTALSKVGNEIFAGVLPTDDVLVYVESDLLWDPYTILALISDLTRLTPKDIVSPLIFAGANFYDVWGFRGLDRSRFAPFPPYHSSLKKDELTEVSSVGSCLVMSGGTARAIRITNNDCLVGWCTNARANGSKIYVDSRFRVDHPA